MSLTKDAAPAYSAGFTHPTDLRHEEDWTALEQERGVLERWERSTRERKRSAREKDEEYW
jgi:hypothetical protein